MSDNEWVKLGVGLVLALIVIIYLNPPHTPCDDEMDIYEAATKPLIKEYNKGYGKCKELTNMGGCIGLFDTIGKLQQKAKELGPQCQKRLASHKASISWTKASVDTLVKVAWGSKPPQSYVQRNGWFELNQLTLYCKAKNLVVELFGQEEFDGIAERLLADLPGAQALGRDETWKRSILSDPCRY